MSKNEKHKQALPRYAMAAGFRGPLYRVEPCIKTAIRKLAAMRWCCRRILWDIDEESDEGVALYGVVEMLYDLEHELYKATKVLHRELDKR